MDSQDRQPGSGQQEWSFATIAAHAGAGRLKDEQPDFIPTVKPVYMSTTFMPTSIEEMDKVFGGEREGFVYGRYANPTVTELEKVVARLEGALGNTAVAFGSGMAALHAAMLASGLSAGERIVASGDLYGQNWALLNGQMRRLGIDTTFVDATNLDETIGAIERMRPRLIVVETISNPLLKVAPVPQIAEAAHRAGALVLVDNTFATPYAVRPFEFGADVVVHSATKYLSGHGDTMGGVAVAAGNDLALELMRVRRDTGAVLSPHDAWLIGRGIRTLPLRFDKQCENARQVADWLVRCPAIEKVNYPGLEPNPLQRLYGTPLGGAMISFVIRDAGRDEVFAFMERLRLVTPATTLGDLGTLVLYPVMSSHRWVDPEARAAIGISEGLVRLSTGVESAGDIIADLEQALAAQRERPTILEPQKEDANR